MTEAVANIPWLPRREAVARAARHRGCAPEDAELQIVGKVKAGQIKCVTSEGYAVSLLPAVSGGIIARDAGSLSCEIANVELLCFIDLVAADLLPAPAERARWSAAEAITYLVKGVPLPWKEWQRAGATAPEIERAEIDLAQVVSEGVPAWGWHPLKKRRKRIPSDHFRDEMIDKKAVPVAVARPPKVVVDCAGCVTTAPRQRSADYQGPRWQAIEVDAAALRRARPRSADPKLAKAKHPRWQRARIITELKSLYPPHGSHPNGTSIAALTKRINNRPNFKDDKVSEDSVERAASEIKAEIKAAREK